VADNPGQTRPALVTRDQVRAVVLSNIRQVLPDLEPDPPWPGATLRDLGANSIDRMDVVIGALDDLGLDLPGQRLAGVHDIDTLIDELWAYATEPAAAGRA
jgi:polyketide biosynthesis acyl carrier protein